MAYGGHRQQVDSLVAEPVVAARVCVFWRARQMRATLQEVDSLANTSVAQTVGWMTPGRFGNHRKRLDLPPRVQRQSAATSCPTHNDPASVVMD